MIFIAGYQPKSRKIGPLDEQSCSQCQHSIFPLLLRRQHYLSLFFIPLVPLQSQWLWQCPQCKLERPLAREAVQKLRPLAALNARALREDWTEERYARERAHCEKHREH